MRGLNILIVGRGKGTDVVAGHALRFIISAKQGQGFISLEDCDSVFQHFGSGNPEAPQAVQHWQDQGWKDKIIQFRGGVIAEQNRIEGIPALDQIVGQQGIKKLNWGAVPADFSGTAHELVEFLLAGPTQFLPALSILCQGFLATHRQAGVDGGSDYKKALDVMGWDQIKDAAIVQNLNGKIDDVQKSLWWRQVIGEDEPEVRKKLVIELGAKSLPNDSKIAQLVGQVYQFPSAKVDDVNLVAGAFLEIADKLQ